MVVRTETFYTCDKCGKSSMFPEEFRALHVSSLHTPSESSKTVHWCVGCIKAAGLQPQVESTVVVRL